MVIFGQVLLDRKVKFRNLMFKMGINKAAVFVFVVVAIVVVNGKNNTFFSSSASN